MMLGVFWFALIRDVDPWKAYGWGAVVYWSCTFDIAFISMTGWNNSENGLWIDLVLSYIAIITAQPWTIFM